METAFNFTLGQTVPHFITCVALSTVGLLLTSAPLLNHVQYTGTLRFDIKHVDKVPISTVKRQLSHFEQ